MMLVMHGMVHRNLVLYVKDPQLGHRYRQIAVVEKQQFEVRIFEGDVVQTDPQFIAQCSDTKISLHPSLQDALADAKMEFERSVQAGWIPC